MTAPLNARAIASLVALGALVLHTVLMASPAPAVPQRSPDHEVLVVTENLTEAYGAEDVRSADEVPVFVNRLLAQTPYRPDVVLLQEVRRKPAAMVARLLTEKTGDRYVMAVAPLRKPTRTIDSTRVLHTTTGIVINASTMRKVDDGGWIRVDYPARLRAAGKKVAVKRMARVMLAERSTGTKLKLASSHMNHRTYFKNLDAFHEYLTIGSKKVARALGSRYQVKGFTAMGGDYNQKRCASGSGRSCGVAPFYKALTETPYTYSEASTYVDFIFTDMRILRSGSDEDGKRLYSDHVFLWAVLGSA